jgi:hypothetical protein
VEFRTEARALTDVGDNFGHFSFQRPMPRGKAAGFPRSQDGLPNRLVERFVNESRC